jgi:AraC-like DNA-binding protein
MEVLSDILRSMRIKGSVYFCDHLAVPWTKTFTDTTTAGFHMIRRGECWVTVGDRTERLGPGDLIFVAPGVDHVLTSHLPGQMAAEYAPRTLLLCGYCDFATDTLTPLLAVFPRVTIVRDEELIRHPWLKSTFDQLSAEYLQQSPGAELVVDKLTEVVLIELIRINFGRQERNPFLAALNDKAISKALQLLHANFERAWTLEVLANAVAMSRAAFAKRFKSLVGQPMFQYLTALRMQKARELLRDTNLPVYEIAGRTGYESDLAFNKTFKKHSGMTPRQYRKAGEPVTG